MPRGRASSRTGWPCTGTHSASISRGPQSPSATNTTARSHPRRGGDPVGPRSPACTPPPREREERHRKGERPGRVGLPPAGQEPGRSREACARRPETRHDGAGVQRKDVQGAEEKPRAACEPQDRLQDPRLQGRQVAANHVHAEQGTTGGDGREQDGEEHADARRARTPRGAPGQQGGHERDDEDEQEHQAHHLARVGPQVGERGPRARAPGEEHPQEEHQDPDHAQSIRDVAREDPAAGSRPDAGTTTAPRPAPPRRPCRGGSVLLRAPG